MSFDLREPVQDVKERRDGLLDLLVARVPFTRFMGIQFDRRGDELTAILPFDEKLIGNARLRALHGGGTAAFLETTAITELAWKALWDDMESGALTPEACEAGQLPPLPKTIDFTIDYLRSGLPRDAYARAKITRRGRRYASVHVEAWQDNRDKLFVQASGHFLMEKTNLMENDTKLQYVHSRDEPKIDAFRKFQNTICEITEGRIDDLDIRDFHIEIMDNDPKKWLVVPRNGTSDKTIENLLNKFSPRYESVTAYHFTGWESFKKIIRKKEFCLHSVIKNIETGEISIPAKSLNMLGLLNDNGTKNCCKIKELSKDMFYSSFRITDDCPDEMWKIFGEEGKGVRLTLRIEPKHQKAELRKVRYLNKNSNTELGSVVKRLTEQGIYLTPAGISSLIAFGVGDKFEDENEIRILIKRYRDYCGAVASPSLFRENAYELDGEQYDVCPLHLLAPDEAGGQQPCSIHLEGIKLGSEAREDEIRYLLKDTKWKSVPIE